MDTIDYRTLADEKADKYLAENLPIELLEFRELFKITYKTGYIDRHLESLEEEKNERPLPTL